VVRKPPYVGLQFSQVKKENDPAGLVVSLIQLESGPVTEYTTADWSIFSTSASRAAQPRGRAGYST
jgi:hypothetical protein